MTRLNESLSPRYCRGRNIGFLAEWLKCSGKRRVSNEFQRSRILEWLQHVESAYLQGIFVTYRITLTHLLTAVAFLQEDLEKFGRFSPKTFADQPLIKTNAPGSPGSDRIRLEFTLNSSEGVFSMGPWGPMSKQMCLREGQVRKQDSYNGLSVTEICSPCVCSWERQYCKKYQMNKSVAVF